jgi:hypothetical protein
MSQIQLNPNSYYQEKYKWTDNTLKTIWWEAHGKAINCYSSKNRQLSKNFYTNGYHAIYKNQNIIPIGPHIELCNETNKGHIQILKYTSCHDRNP